VWKGHRSKDKRYPGDNRLISPSQGYGCSPFKAVRELGSERRETVRSLSAVGARRLRRVDPSTRGPGRTNHWCTSCPAKGTAR